MRINYNFINFKFFFTVSKRGFTTLANALISNAANLNIRDKSNNTALYYGN